MNREKDMAFVVHTEEDFEILTKVLFRHKLAYYVVIQRYDMLNADYRVVTALLNPKGIKRVLETYTTMGGYEEPTIQFR